MKLHQNSVFSSISHTNWLLKYSSFSYQSTFYLEMFCDFSAISNDDKMPVKKKLVELQVVRLFLTKSYLLLSLITQTTNKICLKSDSEHNE